MSNEIDRVLCADWSKDVSKRAVYEVMVSERLIRRVAGQDWTVSSVLQLASGQSKTLVTFDAPLGVPASFFDALRADPSLASPTTFIDWLPGAGLEESETAAAWSIRRPFFRVPAGRGGLRGFEAAAAAMGVALRRKIERETGAKPVFVVAGVPGSVGSAARDIWNGLTESRRQGTGFKVWPFDGGLDDLLGSGVPVVAEIYPRAAYSTALIDAAPRPRLAVSKTRARVRLCAIRDLLATQWVAATGVQIQDTCAAAQGEDDFDALMTGAALFRCLAEGLPLFAEPLHRPEAEGGILGTGSVDLAMPERAFRRRCAFRGFWADRSSSGNQGH